MSSQPVICGESGFDTVKITINGKLHLRLKRSQFLGLQSWRWCNGHYCLEITMVGGVMLCDYDTEQKWLDILEALDRLL